MKGVFAMKFCEYIKKARELAGLTQESAAGLIDVSVTTIQNWEKGQMPSGKENLNRIAEVYKVNYEEFWSFYAEEMMPRKKTKEKCDFPFFLFSDEEGKKIASLYLDTREQELLGMEYLYSQPHNISGQINMDEKFSYSCDLLSMQTHPLSNIPYQYIKEHGAFNTVALYNGLTTKLGLYKDVVVKYLVEHPQEIFDVSTIESADIYNFFKPDVLNVLHLLIDIFENNFTKDKVAIYCNENNAILPVYDMYLEENIYRAIDKEICEKKMSITDKMRKNIYKILEKQFFVEDYIIEFPHNYSTIDELYKSIKFKKWYSKYFKISKSEDTIYFSATEDGRKLYEWYLTTGKNVVVLYPCLQDLLMPALNLTKQNICV